MLILSIYSRKMHKKNCNLLSSKKIAFNNKNWKYFIDLAQIKSIITIRLNIIKY